MDNLLFCLNATVPVFMLMILGFFFRKINLFDDAFVSKANKFVFTVALPVMVFEDLASTDFVSSWDGRFVLFCFAVTVISIFLAFLLSLFFRKKYSQGEFIQAAYRSSAAILGIALIQNIYGNTGMAPLMIIGSVPLYNIMAVVVLEFFKPCRKCEPFGDISSTKKTVAAFRKSMLFDTIKGVLTNPILIGIFLGIVWSVLHIPMPNMLSKTLGYVGNLATPLGLMAMGAAFDFKKAFGCLKPALVCAFMKLIGFAALFLPLSLSLGFRDSQMIAILVMLGSATTVSSFVMAKNMGHDGVLSSSVVMITTFFSAFTLTLWLFVLRTGGFI